MRKKDFILSEIKRLVLEKEPDAKIYLYGSRARGNNRKHSDWDILILLNKAKITFDLEQEITFPLYDLEFETGEIISPQVYSETEWNSKYYLTPFYNNVTSEGKLL
jgi:uncharacterized protein